MHQQPADCDLAQALANHPVLKAQSSSPTPCFRKFESRPTEFVYQLDQSPRSQRCCFDLAADTSGKSHQNPRPSVQYLLQHRPLAVLSLLPRPAVLFAAGAISGAIGKTLTAPLDRVKLLLQTSGGLQQGAVKQAVRKGGVWEALAAIGRTEGIRGYWKGNLPQVCQSVAIG